MDDDIVTLLANMATDQVRYRTHYEGCHVYHLECAALIVCDEIERLRAQEQDLRMYAEQDACEIERLRSALDAEGNDANLLMLEIERLRAAGDALAESVDWRGLTLDIYNKLAGWREARLPESVIDWVLGDELRVSAEQTEVNQGEIVLNGRIYRRVHGTWVVRQHLGPDFVPVIQALGDALDEIEHLRTAGTALADAIHHADWCPASYSEGRDCDDQCGVAAAVTAWMRSGGHA